MYLPAGILEKVDLKSPVTTVALLKMNATFFSTTSFSRSLSVQVAERWSA